jgi:hypothetical protein
MKYRIGQTKVGAAGTATEVLHELEASDKPDFQGTVKLWFLHCPGQSPAWRHYHLAIIHLRPIEGVKPAVISRPGATHEVILVALDPKGNPVADNPESWQFLHPVNFVGQLTLPSDEAAKMVIDVLARATAEGILWAEPPLSGQEEPWQSQLRHLEAHAAGKHTH